MRALITEEETGLVFSRFVVQFSAEEQAEVTGLCSAPRSGVCSHGKHWSVKPSRACADEGVREQR